MPNDCVYVDLRLLRPWRDAKLFSTSKTVLINMSAGVGLSVCVFLQCTDKLERDRLILFLNKLILNKVWDTMLIKLLIQRETCVSRKRFYDFDIPVQTEKCEGDDGL